MNNHRKFVLITGASTGIGYELAKLFAKNQYNLLLVARDQNELDKAKSKIRSEHEVEIYTIVNDLSDRQGPFEVYKEVKDKGIEVNVLVNNAGQGEFGEFVHTDIHRELEIIQLNIGAYVVLTKLFVKDMLMRDEGKILNVGSIAGEIPGPWQSVYHGTKAFVNSWTEAIRSELKDTSLSVTLLLPGATDTDFFAKADMERSKMVQENDLADPAKVAKDGFEALMKGDDKVISGIKNKAMVAMAQVMPDSMAADNMKKQQKPVDKKG